MMARPVVSPPVNDTMSTRGSSVSGAPTAAPAPSTRLATPSGSSASTSSPMSRTAVCGVSSLGFRTKVLPAPSAGATFHAVWSSG
ncbi:hypothetical protein SCYAM73S_04885 [Streptomyces cyaneofuscatus]